MTAAALSSNAGSLTMARAQLPSFDDVADSLWITDTGATADMTPHQVFLLDLCFQHILMILVLTWFYLVFRFDDHPWLLIPIPLMWHCVVLL